MLFSLCSQQNNCLPVCYKTGSKAHLDVMFPFSAYVFIHQQCIEIPKSPPVRLGCTKVDHYCISQLYTKKLRKNELDESLTFAY